MVQNSMMEGLMSLFDFMHKAGGLTTGDATSAVQRAVQDPTWARMLDPIQFTLLLKHFKVPISEYGKRNAKSVRDLWCEVVVGTSHLEKTAAKPEGQVLLRRVKIAVVELLATLDGEDKILMLKNMTTESGCVRKDLDARLTRKMFDDEERSPAMWRCLTQNLGLPEQACKDHFEIESSKDLEEVRVSSGFPGLNTHYTLCVTRARVRDPTSPALQSLGLPGGEEFETDVVDMFKLGSMRQWKWCPRETVEPLFAVEKAADADAMPRCVYAAASHPRSAFRLASVAVLLVLLAALLSESLGY